MLWILLPCLNISSHFEDIFLQFIQDRFMFEQLSILLDDNYEMMVTKNPIPKVGLHIRKKGKF
jgi:hypothetical protein